MTEEIPTLIDALSKKSGVSRIDIIGSSGETCGSVMIPHCPQNSKLVGDTQNYGPILLGGRVEGQHQPPTTDATSQEFLRKRRTQSRKSLEHKLKQEPSKKNSSFYTRLILRPPLSSIQF